MKTLIFKPAKVMVLRPAVKNVSKEKALLEIKDAIKEIKLEHYDC